MADIAADYDKFQKTFEGSIMVIMKEIAGAFIEEGFEVDGPDNLSCDDIWWDMTVRGKGLSEPVSVAIKIPFSEDYDGTENGLNFMLDIVAEGGRMVGGLTPFNYTDRVWVNRDDPKAIEERWLLFKNAMDVNEIVYSVEKWYKED